jgi:hypothetical protein
MFRKDAVTLEELDLVRLFWENVGISENDAPVLALRLNRTSTAA